MPDIMCIKGAREFKDIREDLFLVGRYETK